MKACTLTLHALIFPHLRQQRFQFLIPILYQTTILCMICNMIRPLDVIPLWSLLHTMDLKAFLLIWKKNVTWDPKWIHYILFQSLYCILSIIIYCQVSKEEPRVRIYSCEYARVISCDYMQSKAVCWPGMWGVSPQDNLPHSHLQFLCLLLVHRW